MKRHILVLCCALFLSSAGTQVARAQAPQGAGTDGKSNRIQVHHHWWQWHWPKREKKVKTPPLYSVPKSTGWWHRHGPGPAGAGVK